MTASLAKQAFALRARFPSSVIAINSRQLTWQGSLQPTPASRDYSVQITYRQEQYPAVRVLEPVLDPRDDASLPHVYDNGCLCLHLPEEWHGEMLIARSTVPWTSEWLLNYEIWHATGTWYGGGEWPPSRTLDTPTRPERRYRARARRRGP
jgi:hypothetical protein